MKYAGTTGISNPFLNAVSQINKNPLCNPSSLDKYPLVESSEKIATELPFWIAFIHSLTVIRNLASLYVEIKFKPYFLTFCSYKT